MSGFYMTVQLVGAKETMAAIDLLVAEAALAAAQAAYDEAVFELGLTKLQVPVFSGQLKASGRVDKYPVDFSGALAYAAIAYGGPAGSGHGQTQDVDYALAVHEDLSAYHAHGNAKYVENVVNDEYGSGRAQARMAENMRLRLAGLLGSFHVRSGLWTKGTGGAFSGSRSGFGG